MLTGRIRVSMGLWTLFLWAGCTAPTQVDDHRDLLALRASPSDDEVAARVDGYPIRLSDVRSLMAADKNIQTPAEALDALIDQHLLAREAIRRGYDQDASVPTERRHALAMAMAKQVVSKTTVDTLDQNKLKKLYEIKKPKYVHDAQRKVVHAVARVGEKFFTDEEARVAIERVSAATAGATEPEQFEKAVGDVRATYYKEKGASNKLKAEQLPPIEEASKRFDQDFVSAMWSIDKPGMISKVIKSGFGYHVILFIEEVPALNRPYEEVWRELGTGVLVDESQMRTDELVGRLEKQAGIFIYESNLSFQGTAP